MKKQDYQTPAMRVVKLKHKCQLLDGSNKMKSNTRLYLDDDDENYTGDIR